MGGRLLFCAAAALALVACSREEPLIPRDDPSSALILRFEASSTSVIKNERVTITWQTDQSTFNQLSTSDGEVLLDTTEQGGFLESSPLLRDTTFVLRAKGEDRRTITATKLVSIIEEPSEVAILQFTATPLTVRGGETTTLRWETTNATALRIEVEGTEVYSTEERLTGATNVAPPVSTTYQLIAEGPGGPKMQSISIVVDSTPRDPPVELGACGDEPRGPSVSWFEEVAVSIPRDIIPPGNAFFGSGGSIGDLDGDGRPDLIIASRGAPITVLKNRGDFAFEELVDRAGIDTRATAAGTALGDLDNDGDQDALILGTQRTFVYENLGDGTFERRTGTVFDTSPNAESAIFGDVDQDGDLDILLNIFGRDIHSMDDEPRRDRLIENHGGFQFEDITAPSQIDEHGASWVSALFDANLDGQLDIYVANDTFSQDYGGGVQTNTAMTPDALLVNRSTRAGIRMAQMAPALGLDMPHSSMGAVIGDFDLDGLFDLYISNFGKNPLYLGQRDMPFIERAEELGVAGIRRENETCTDDNPECLLISWGALFEDFDNDGAADLLVTNGGFVGELAQPSLLFVRSGSPGSFRYEEREPGLGCFDGRALLPADLDDDGDLDLVVIPRNDPVRVFKNHAPVENGWVRVKLEGRTTNRDGAGAIVTLELDTGEKQMRAVGAGGMVHSTLLPEAHFGLGERDAVSVTIHWPSGQVQIVPNVARNQILYIVEPN